MAYTELQLEQANNSELASSKPIFATDHRSVNGKLIDEMFDPQSRANLFAGLGSLASPLSTDGLFVIRGGVAYLIPASVLDFVQNFTDLSDVAIPTPVDGQVVYYEAATQKFKLKSINDIAGGVVFVANIAGLPVTGTSDIIYVSLSTTEPSRLFYWNGSAYVDLYAGIKSDVVSTSTVGATITLDFANKLKRKFVGSASFSTPKTIAYSNETNAIEYTAMLNITDVAAVLTLESNTLCNAAGWDTGAKTWTPPYSGKFKLNAEKDGTDFWLEIREAFS